MMGWIVRVVLVLLIAVVTAIATMPLSVVTERVRPQLVGVDWAQAQGTVWSGRLSNVRYGAQPIGDFELDLQPSALLSGRMVYDLEMVGPVAAGTATAYAQSGRVGVNDLDISARLEQLVGMNAAIRQAGGVARVSGVNVELDRAGCVSASGRVLTDALVNLGVQYGETLPELTGAISCDNQMLVLSMNGEAEGGISVDVDLRVGLREPSRLEAEVGGARGEIAQVLAALGFTVDNGKFVYVRESALTGGGG